MAKTVKELSKEMDVRFEVIDGQLKQVIQIAMNHNARSRARHNILVKLFNQIWEREAKKEGKR